MQPRGRSPTTAGHRRGGRTPFHGNFSPLHISSTSPKKTPNRIRRRISAPGAVARGPGARSGSVTRALVCLTLPESSGHLVFGTPRRGLPSCESSQVTLAWTPPQPISSAGRAGFCHKSVWTAARAKESIHPPPRSAPTAWLCRVRARFPEAPEPTGAPRLPNSNRT